MTKVLIASFSQTGSTRKIADQITKGLSESNMEVTHLIITPGTKPDIREYDIIGIGTPVFFFRPPFLVKDFIKNLEGLENKASFAFILQGTNQGSCGNWIRKELINKGSRDLGYYKSFGADYWIGYIKRGIMFSPDSPTEQELSSAESFGKTIALRYTDKSLEIEKYDSPTHFIYGIEQFFVARPFAKILYSKTFYADNNCNNCGICIKKCPVDNIQYNNNGKPAWDNKCILCASCELNCPKDAIHSALDWPIFSPFMLYNISRSKKKKIPFSSVTHSNGKTMII